MVDEAVTFFSQVNVRRRLSCNVAPRTPTDNPTTYPTLRRATCNSRSWRRIASTWVN